MHLLAIEASTQTPSCALSIDGTIHQWIGPDERNSSETLLPGIMALLVEHGLRLEQLDGIAFGAGPGAFTGLRVAAGMTQGLAFAAGLKVLPVETLAAVAWANGAEYTLAALDARMSEIYAATYQRQGDRLLRLGEMQVDSPDRLAIPDSAAGWTVCGNAAAAYPAFAARLDGWQVAAPTVPLAGAIAELGCRMLADGGALDAEFAQPVYVRDKVAFTIAERLAKGGRA